MIKKVIKQKGFTLIELLVVISIISLLSSVILGSIKTARDKATDAAIKEQLIALRNQAELYRSNHENYGDLSASSETLTGYDHFQDSNAEAGGCVGFFGDGLGNSVPVHFNDPSLLSASEHVYRLSESVQCSLMGSSGLTGQAEVIITWGFAARLKSDPLKGWCVDSAGASREVNYPINNEIINRYSSSVADIALADTGLCANN